MKLKLGQVCALALAAAAFAAPAWGADVYRGAGAATVFGTGQGRLCYEAARDGYSNDYAISLCNEALNVSVLTRRDRAATYINRGVLRLHRREAKMAMADFNAALAIKPEMGEAHADRGTALILLGDPQAAIVELSKSLDMRASEPQDAYFNRAIAYEQTGDVTAAYHDYQAALQLKPNWRLPQQELQRFKVTPAD